MSTYLVLDGGGSSTDVAAVRSGDVSGKIVARTSLPSFKPTPESQGTADLARALGVWLATTVPDVTLSYVLVGMAGVWADVERRRYLQDLADAWEQYIAADVPRITVISDVELVQLAALGDGPGVICIAGTGSIAVGRRADGRTIRVGGWGPRIDDAGGGFWIGREALNAVVRMLDGRGPATELLKPVASWLRCDPSDTVTLQNALRSTGIDRAARLAEAVLSYADEGDAVAVSIRTRAAHELAGLITTARRVVGEGPIVGYGSLLNNANLIDTIETVIGEPLLPLTDVLDGVIRRLQAV